MDAKSTRMSDTTETTDPLDEYMEEARKTVKEEPEPEAQEDEACTLVTDQEVVCTGEDRSTEVKENNRIQRTLRRLQLLLSKKEEREKVATEVTGNTTVRTGKRRRQESPLLLETVSKGKEKTVENKPVSRASESVVPVRIFKDLQTPQNRTLDTVPEDIEMVDAG